jgi:hypothetical protein
MKPRFNLKGIFTARYAATLLSILIFAFYIAAPLAIFSFATNNPLYLKMAGMATITLIGIAVGRMLPTITPHLSKRPKKLVISERRLTYGTFAIFLSFVILTTYTAASIPIFSAIQGFTSEDLSNERGAFLKGREGAWILLLYISSILSSSILPYSILLAFHTKHHLRKVFAATFLIYSSLFLVKALFLNLLLPIGSYTIEKSPSRFGKTLSYLITAVAVLLFMIWISGYGSLEATSSFDMSDYFSTRYIPTGVFDYLVYRSFAVPVFSVVDTLHVHETLFNGELLQGKTSSLIAGLLGVEKINIERYVAEYQYGGWNDFANSNVAFFVDGYVNFGWIGVLIFGIIVGQIYKYFSNSDDIAFRSLSLLFTYQLLASPLIQMLLSNGWIILFFAMAYTRLSKRRSSPQQYEFKNL